MVPGSIRRPPIRPGQTGREQNGRQRVTQCRSVTVVAATRGGVAHGSRPPASSATIERWTGVRVTAQRSKPRKPGLLTSGFKAKVEHLKLLHLVLFFMISRNKAVQLSDKTVIGISNDQRTGKIGNGTLVSSMHRATIRRSFRAENHNDSGR